jgi:citrate synthase
MNASTFTARVIASTGADVGGGAVGRVGAMSGPLHGGAPAGDPDDRGGRETGDARSVVGHPRPPRS